MRLKSRTGHQANPLNASQSNRNENAFNYTSSMTNHSRLFQQNQAQNRRIQNSSSARVPGHDPRF